MDKKQQVIDMCKNKTSNQVLDMIREAKLNDAPHKTIQIMQQISDERNTAEKQRTSRIAVGMSAWVNYCRESRLYRLLERIGLR